MVACKLRRLFAPACQHFRQVFGLRPTPLKHPRGQGEALRVLMSPMYGVICCLPPEQTS